MSAAAGGAAQRGPGRGNSAARFRGASAHPSVSEAVLLDQIDIMFANKVLVDVGLCITLFDFLEVGDPYIYPAEGSAHQRVKFRMVVFRPFVGEVRCLRRRRPLHCR